MLNSCISQKRLRDAQSSRNARAFQNLISVCAVIAGFHNADANVRIDNSLEGVDISPLIPST